MAVKPSQVHSHKERALFLLKEECKKWEDYIDNQLLALPLDKGNSTRILIIDEPADTKNSRKVDYILGLYEEAGWKVKYEPFPMMGEVLVSFIFTKP